MRRARRTSWARRALVPGAALLLVALAALAGRSAARGGWPEVALLPVLSGLLNPTHVTSAGDGTNRLFIIEQRGVIRIVREGALLATPFLDIDGRVKNLSIEQGLLSVAFPPGYASKQYFYVYYTDNSNALQLSRFRVTGANPDVADPNSEQKLLTIPHPDYLSHNGGQLAFGPDGYLYMFTGDGGLGAPRANAQDIESLLGKALRLDVESEPTSAGYRIPPTNPFVGLPGRDELWAYGLRNPWRASFDRAMGDLYIADVGQDAWEEVNVQPAGSAGGENYGWPCFEGAHAFDPGCDPEPAIYTWPVAEYAHAPDCAVTGGHLYRGSLYPALTGLYFYTDVCTGRLWALRRAGSGWESHAYPDLLGGGLTSFGEDEAGELYLVSRGGALFRLADPTAPPTPTATIDPTWPKRYLPMILKEE